ncbi:hypothetical protein Pmani_025086 [Petrolisthes manimaculis]|uniref:Uncharacterized protein n=1 Tax=Petrolisthes manimaculis TaxID=1843537 RepID=A0AAE1P8U2_9EUCA|nr:hypothetical protein Pmani_025086 [Petrolisthes manimaculis]
MSATGLVYSSGRRNRGKHRRQSIHFKVEVHCFPITPTSFITPTTAISPGTSCPLKESLWEVCDLIRECRRHRGHQRDRAVKTSLSVPEKPVTVECVSVGGGAVLGDPSIPRRLLLVFPFLLSPQVQDAWNVGGVSVGGDGLTQGHSEWTLICCLIVGRVPFKILQLVRRCQCITGAINETEHRPVTQTAVYEQAV